MSFWSFTNSSGAGSTPAETGLSVGVEEAAVGSVDVGVVAAAVAGAVGVVDSWLQATSRSMSVRATDVRMAWMVMRPPWGVAWLLFGTPGSIGAM